jgi:hypothetical protein
MCSDNGYRALRTHTNPPVSGSSTYKGACPQGTRNAFLVAYGPIAQHFRPRRHRFSALACWSELCIDGLYWGDNAADVMMYLRAQGVSPNEITQASEGVDPRERVWRRRVVLLALDICLLHVV